MTKTQAADIRIQMYLRLANAKERAEREVEQRLKTRRTK